MLHCVCHHLFAAVLVLFALQSNPLCQDLFLEEDIEYAKRLIGDGVPTELRVIAGAPHGWDFIEREATSAKEAHQYWKSVLKKALLN